VTGTGDPDAGHWPAPGDGWDEGCDGVLGGVASHAAIASADASAGNHIHLADRADTAERIDERYRRSG
jgi:hypothetical protein